MRIKLCVPMTLGEIAKAIGGLCKGKYSERAVEYISTDTRDIYENDLFVPRLGEKYNGDAFARDAFSIGSYIISKETPEAHIKVQNIDNVLLLLSEYYLREKLNPKIKISITGSVGKTTTKEFLKTIFNQQYKTHATKDNLNNQFGVPFTLLSAGAESDAIITEFGMNSPGEISRLSKAVRPDIGIITKIGTAHIGRLGSREGIAKAKLEILDGMWESRLIAPASEPLLKDYTWRSFSARDDLASCFIKRVGKSVSIKLPSGRFIFAPFSPIGESNLECLSAACAAAESAGVSPEAIKRGVSLISGNNTRQNIYKLCDRYIIDDSYNASLESFTAAFDMMSEYKDMPKRSAVLGCVLELGEHSESIHGMIGAAAASAGLGQMFLVGDEAEYIADGAIAAGFPKSKIFVFKSADEAGEIKDAIIKHTAPGELILIKGSHALNLSKITNELKRSTENIQ